jgi:hypothetical protein
MDIRTLPLLFWLAAAALPPAEPADERPGAAAAVSDRAIRSDVDWALSSAVRKLKKPGCRSIFSDFVDSEGRTLQRNLDLRGETSLQLLRSLRFRDGTGDRPCLDEAILAFTTTRSQVISICGPRFRRALRERPALAANIVIHEALHRLGLEETPRSERASSSRRPVPSRPPTSSEITDRVAARCGS